VVTKVVTKVIKKTGILKPPTSPPVVEGSPPRRRPSFPGPEATSSLAAEKPAKPVRQWGGRPRLPSVKAIRFTGFRFSSCGRLGRPARALARN
jgi:hypothetical protein